MVSSDVERPTRGWGGGGSYCVYQEVGSRGDARHQMGQIALAEAYGREKGHKIPGDGMPLYNCNGAGRVPRAWLLAHPVFSQIKGLSANQA
jgi:hypothetical protein